MHYPQQLPLALSISELKSFDNYIAAQNQAIVEQLKAFVARTQNSFSDNGVLFLWGSDFVGKSHLLSACCRLATAETKLAIHLPMQELSEYSVDLLDGLEKYDLVCIDDVDAIAGHADWEQGLFHLFNRLQDTSGLFLATATRNIAACEFSLPDFASRLAWGLVYHLEPLDDITKQSFLVSRASARGIEIEEKVAQFIIQHYSRNLADLLESLERIDAAGLAEQRRVTIPFLREILGR